MSKILDGLRDAVAGRFSRVTVISHRKITINGVERDMTPEEIAKFHGVFSEMDKAFDGLSRAFRDAKKKP